MAQEYNVTWQEYNGTDYDKLYPKTKASNVAINSTTALSDVVVYGEPLRYNLSQQSLYFHKNGLLINRQTNNVDMYLSSDEKDYDTLYHMVDVNGVPVLVDKIADSISGNTSSAMALLGKETSEIFNFSPNGYGVLSAVSMSATFSGGSEIQSCRVKIYSNSSLVWQSDDVRWSSGSTLTVSPNVEIVKNATYSVRLFIGSEGSSRIDISAGTFTTTFTGETYTSGYFTTKQFAMTDGNKLQTWLYYTGTAPTVSYNVGSGTYTALTPSSTSASVFMDGTACTVAKYDIDGSIVKNNVVKFKFDVSSSSTIIKEMCGVLL